MDVYKLTKSFTQTAKEYWIRMVIWRILKSFNEFGNVMTPPSSGCPRGTTSNDDRMIVREVKLIVG
jgi:hypothetical protein